METISYISCITLQWHLIARCVDTMKLEFSDVSLNLQHLVTSIAKMWLSKNISQEKELPDQVVHGSMLPSLYPLLNLPIYIEICGRQRNETFTDFIFGNPKKDTGVFVKR